MTVFMFFDFKVRDNTDRYPRNVRLSSGIPLELCQAAQTQDAHTDVLRGYLLPLLH